LPARQWHLSAEGRRRCVALASRLALYQPDVIVSSIEPKAVETGQIIAGCLGLTCSTLEGLHEHERPVADRVFDRQQFEAQVAEFFHRPSDLVMGAETADQAHERFAQAIGSAVSQHPEQNVAVVAHGTVITLFVGRAASLEPFAFWQQLGLPSFAVLPLPGMNTVQVVNSLADVTPLT
jgi:broad specificity phosphatase PhoE